MEVKSAKEMFDYGILTKAEVVPTPMNSGWYVQFIGGKTIHVLESQRADVRTFRTLDAAAKTIKEIGFPEFAVKQLQI